MDAGEHFSPRGLWPHHLPDRAVQLYADEQPAAAGHRHIGDARALASLEGRASAVVVKGDSLDVTGSENSAAVGEGNALKAGAHRGTPFIASRAIIPAAIFPDLARPPARGSCLYAYASASASASADPG